jgi:3-isopropylmalate/(R)-2-methylmalate dehydratase small subunit
MTFRRIIRGRAFVFGPNIDTDIIIPAHYLTSIDREALAVHCMEPLRPGFAATSDGGIVVAAENFGCGSSREHAPLALLGAGIRCVVADSFARIFFRNAVNTGLPVVICTGIHAAVAEGEELTVDLDGGTVTVGPSGRTLSFPPLPPFMTGILEAGGLIPYLKGRSLSYR